MLQSKENMDILIEDKLDLPTTESKLVKDILSGEYDSSSKDEHYFVDYFNDKLDKVFGNTERYDWDWDWEFFAHYYLSKYIHLYIDANLFKYYNVGTIGIRLYDANHKLCWLDRRNLYTDHTLAKLSQSNAKRVKGT